MTNDLIPELRLVNKDGSLGEILPDWTSLSHQGTDSELGVGSFTYPKEGRHVDLIQDRVELTVVVNGQEIPNGRFYYEESSGNELSEDDSDIKTIGGSAIGIDLDRCVLMPSKDPFAKQNVMTPEERKRYMELATEWARKQRQKNYEDMRDDRLHGDDPVQDLSDRGDANKDGKVDWRDYNPNTMWENKISGAPPPIPPRWTEATPGEMLIDAIADAKRRGLLKKYRIDFTPTHDSAGHKWDEKITHRFEIGTTAYGMCTWFHDRNIAELRVTKWTIQLFNTGSGRDLSGEIVLAQAFNVEDSPVAHSVKDRINCCYVVSDTGVHGWVDNKEMIRNDGTRLEGYLSVSGVKLWRECIEAGNRAIQSSRVTNDAFTYGITPGSGQDPYFDFTIGDYIGALIGGSVVKQRVHTISMDWDDEENLTLAVGCGARMVPKQYRDHQALNQMRGGAINNLLSQGVTQTALEIPDGEGPRQPSPPIITGRNGMAQIGWDGLDYEGNEMTFDTKLVQVHMSEPGDLDFTASSDTFMGNISDGGFLQLSHLPYLDQRAFRLVAMDHGGDLSDQSDTADVTIPFTDSIQSDDYVEGVSGWKLDTNNAQLPSVNVLDTVGTQSLSAENIDLDGNDLQQALDDISQGLVAWGHLGSTSGDNTAAVGTTEKVLFRFSTGSLLNAKYYQIGYRFSFVPPGSGNHGNFVARLRFTTDGTLAGLSSPILDGSKAIFSNSDDGGVCYVSTFYSPSSDVDNLRMCLTLEKLSGTDGAVRVVSPDDRVELFAIDMGLQSQVSDTALVQVSHSSSGDDNDDPPTNHVHSWLPTWSQNYDSDNSKRQGDLSNPDLYQGFFSGTHGNTKSLFGYDSSNIQSILSGATIVKVTLTFAVKHSYYYGGLDVRLKSHNFSGEPGSYSNTGAVTSINNVKPGSTRTITIANSYGTDLKNGDCKGFGFGPGDSSSLDYYGYMYGIGSGRAPKLTITYKK